MGAACGGSDLVLPEDPRPIVLEVRRGDGQSAPPGEELPQPIVVSVRDSAGLPLPDVEVAFELGAGAEGGATLPATAVTDDDGEASARWVLGEGLGQQRVTAEVVGAGLDGVSFTATAVVDAPQPSAQQSSVTASPESIEAVTGLSVIRVTVRDGQGDAFSGATVTLVATGADNVLNQPLEPTDEDGIAEGSLRAITPGTRVVSAVVNGSVTIEETAAVDVVVTPTADRLVFLVQPVDTEEEEIISPAVVVAIVDGEGDVVPLSDVEIELELIGEKGEDSKELEGDTAEATDEGIAVFPELRVDRDDEDYRLRATAPDRPDLGSVDSETFDIGD